MSNTFPDASVDFNIEMREDVVDFFKRMIEESKNREQAVRARIMQLFGEQVVRARIMQLFGEQVGIDMSDDIDADDAIAAYNQLVKLFTIGYQCGWHDRCSVMNNEKDIKRMEDEADI